MRYSFLVLFAVAAMTLALEGCGGGGSKQSGYTIAVIPKGTTHEFWKSIHAGALKAAGELGNVEVIWKGPLKEDDREEQIAIVETFISAGVDAIVLAPLDNRSLVRPVREAKAQDIPTVVIDSDLDGEDHVSFVATDNYKGGVLAADRMGELTGGTGKLIMLRYQEGSASTANREQGFIDTIKQKYPNIEVLSDNQYGGATTESSYRSSENLLNRYPEVQAIFTPNESTTFGCLRALQDRGLAGKLIFVGFDSSEKLVEALAKREIQGLVLQNPFQMGYLGLKAAVDYLEGREVPNRVDTGVTLATPENMNEPAIHELLAPDLATYLQ